MDAFVAKLAAWWAGTSTTEMVWLTIGFTAQLMFSMRFILQWIASERAKQSIVPEVFWYFSFAGGTMLFAYAIYRVDPVFIMGQGTGLLIYARNIHFIWKDKQAANKDGSSQKVAAE
ncbi:MAG: lipid-A-disaccharide synthase N-terminal domain-containing protein [Pseudomonadota bacterium]